MPDVDNRAARWRNRACPIKRRFVGQQRDRFTILKDEAQSLWRISRVQRDIGTAASTGAEDCLDRQKLVVEKKPDASRSLFTLFMQSPDMPRNCSSRCIELPEGDLGFALNNRNLVRTARRDLREPDADRLRSGA